MTRPNEAQARLLSVLSTEGKISINRACGIVGGLRPGRCVRSLEKHGWAKSDGTLEIEITEKGRKASSDDKPQASSLEPRAEQTKREQLREKMDTWRAEREAEKAEVEPEPRYDEVYEAGAAWLDDLARGDQEPKTGNGMTRLSCGHFSFWTKDGACDGCRRKVPKPRPPWTKLACGHMGPTDDRCWHCG